SSSPTTCDHLRTSVPCSPTPSAPEAPLSGRRLAPTGVGHQGHSPTPTATCGKWPTTLAGPLTKTARCAFDHARRSGAATPGGRRRLGCWQPGADNGGTYSGPPDRRRLGGSVCWGADPEPVAVGVAKFDLAPVGWLVFGSAELGNDSVDITHYQVDQGVWPGITLVLGQEQPRPATRDRDERGHAGLEAVLPLFDESQALIPADRVGSVGDVQDRDGFLVHAGMVSQTCDRPVGLAGQATFDAAPMTAAPSLTSTSRGRPGMSLSAALGTVATKASTNSRRVQHAAGRTLRRLAYFTPGGG